MICARLNPKIVFYIIDFTVFFNVKQFFMGKVRGIMKGGKTRIWSNVPDFLMRLMQTGIKNYGIV